MPPPTPRPARQSGSSSRPSVAPMSERQQMALLMQMTSTANEAELSPGGNTIRNRDRNERGETALHLAAKKGDHETVKKLLEQGVNPNMTDFAGWTPLHEAANHGHYSVAVVLAKAGANVNAAGLDDITPLHDAAGVGQLKMVKMLIEKGADPLFKNKKGKTPQDLAHVSLYNYFSHVVEMAKSQQLKKTTDVKKTSEEDDTSGSAPTTSTFTNPTLSLNKDEVDVYEFKSTPKDSSCSSGDEKSDGGKNSDKSSDEKSGTDSDNPTIPSTTQPKRPFADLDNTEENDTANTDEDSKRKKRNFEINTKDGAKTNAGGRVVLRYEKGTKQPGPASKTLNLPANKNTSLQQDRKSPCPSPKPSKSANDSDVDAEDNDSSGAASQKVPPLKIVIPQSGGSTEDSNNSRANKNTSTRNQSLPYVVSNNPDSSTEKEACPSPAESTKSGDDKIPLSKEDRTQQQRVLRSAHKSGSSGQGSSTVDRGSNNSSPQNSSSPSPAATSGTESNQVANHQQSNTNSNSSSSSANNQQPPSTSELENVSSPPSTISTITNTTLTVSLQNSVELHPRKRKIKASKDQVPATTSATVVQAPLVVEEKPDPTTTDSEVHPHDQPFTNCYQMYINIRRQVERRQKTLQVVQPKPPQGFKDYLLNRRTYVLAGKRSNDPIVVLPVNLPTEMKDLFTTQEKERHKLKMQHIVEKEKLVLSVEQEILREHGRAARALANQSQPFSACTILREQEVYNVITPEQEEKDRNARSRYNGRLFLSWLQDVDDKWEKIKEAMILRHHNEAESLHAVQKMDYEWKMKEVALCEYKAKPVIEEHFVPIVHVSDDFDLRPN